jgi:hypothetical protein
MYLAARCPVFNIDLMKRFLLLTGLLLLSSCRVGESGKELAHGVAGDVRTARLSIELLGEEEGEWRVGIALENPAEVPVQSIRSWIQFDAARLGISDLHIEDGRFVLFAPGEKVIEDEGFIQLGGAVREVITDKNLLFASFRVRERSGRKSGTPTFLSFYDWRAEGNGHTAVLSLGSHGAVNIIEAPSVFMLP